jgi:preprotein translocase subunit SecG
MHSPPSAGSPTPFDETEQRVFEEDDTQTLKRVVAIMSAIFTIGVVLYAWIAFFTAGGV